MLYKVKYTLFESDYISDFYILSCCFLHAVEKANDHLEEMLDGPEGWDILSVKNMLNFVEDPQEVMINPNEGHCHECNANYEGKGSCPFCSAKTCDPKLLMKVDCPKCNEGFEVLNNEWTAIFCPKCNEKIKKTDIFNKKRQ